MALDMDMALAMVLVLDLAMAMAMAMAMEMKQVMADLKQALRWLAEGKKIHTSDLHGEFLHVIDDKIVDRDGRQLGGWFFGKGWELYEEQCNSLEKAKKCVEASLDGPIQEYDLHMAVSWIITYLNEKEKE